jgi:uncharacterized damage-inducible protein DinB
VKFDVIWFDRKFNFVLSPEQFPAVVERLRGVPARLEEKLKGIPKEILTRKKGESWSIQEQVGHLLDVEILWDVRVDDFLQKKEVLHPADITGTVTKHANHNSADIADLLKRFRNTREKLVARFDALDKSAPAMTAKHPRLNQPMRMIDHVLFIAEHDDHHLAKMHDLIQEFS